MILWDKQYNWLNSSQTGQPKNKEIKYVLKNLPTNETPGVGDINGKSTIHWRKK